MTTSIQDIDGVRVLVCGSSGPALASANDFKDLIPLAWADDASLVAVPVERLDETFLDLKSGIAGEVIQKYVNYRLRLAFVGDVSARLAQSRALRDFVRETNKGDAIWFVDDFAELGGKLAAQRAGA